MAEQVINQMRDLLEKFNTEATYINENLQQLRDRDDLTVDQIVEQLQSLKSEITSETHLQSIDNSISQLTNNYSDQEGVLSQEEITKGLNETMKSFSTNIVDKLSGLQERMGDVVNNNQEIVSGIGRIGSYFDDVISPFRELTDLAGGLFDIIKGVFGYIMLLPGLFRSIFGSQQKQSQQEQNLIKNVANETRETNETLTDIYSLRKQEQKREIRESLGDQATGGLLSGLMERLGLGASVGVGAGAGGVLGGILASSIGAALTTLGITIGASIRSLILPFEIIGKALNKFIPLSKWFSNVVDNVTTVLNKFKIGSKIVDSFSGIFKYVQNMIKIADNATGVIGKLVGGLKFGFKVLGWPLTIILGAIDFVKGFVSEQGSMLDKMKAGMSEALTGFFELPAKLLGWLTDWVLGLFGVQIEGGAGSKILSMLTETSNTIIDWIMSPITSVKNFIEGFSSEDGSFIDKVKSGLEEVLKGIIDIPTNFIRNIMQNVLGMDTTAFDNQVEDLKSNLGFAIDMLIWPFKQIYDSISWLIDSVTSAEPNTGVFGRIKTYFSIVLDTLLLPFKTALEGLKLLWNVVTGDWSGAMDNIKNVGSMLTGLGDKIWEFITGLIPSWEDIKSAITSADQWWVQNVTKPINSRIVSIIQWFKDLIPSWEVIKSAIGSVGDWWKEHITTPIKDRVDSVKQWFKNLLPSWEKISDKIPEFDPISWVVDPIVNLFNKLKEFFTDLIPSWDTILKEIKKRIPEGIPNYLLPEVLESPTTDSGDFNPDDYKSRETIGSYGQGMSPQSFDKIDDWDEVKKLNVNQVSRILESGRDDFNPRTKEKLREIIAEKKFINNEWDKVTTPNNRDNVGEAVESNIRSEQEQKRREQTDRKKTLERMEKLSNTMYNNNLQYLINNNQQQTNNNETNREDVTQTQFPTREAPDEIENLSLFLFNKNWGIV